MLRLAASMPGRRDDAVAIANGLFGDALDERDSRFSTPMTLRVGGTVLPVDDDLLHEAAETLRAWAAVAEQAWQDGVDIAAALEAAFAGDFADADPELRERAETLNGVHSNAAGFQRWLDQRNNPPTAGQPHHSH